MLHEHAHLIGITEKVAMVGYALFLLGFLAATLPVAHKTQWNLLVTSLAFLALSTLIDVIYPPTPGSVLIEEVFKFGGITFLAAYLVTLSFSALVEPRLSEEGNGVPASRSTEIKVDGR